MEREELYLEYRKATILKGVNPIGKRRFNGIVDTLNEIEQVKKLNMDDVSVSLPSFLYEDDGEIKVGVRGDSIVTENWRKYNER